MRNIWTIAKREISTYFSSPVAYAVAFLFLGIVGLIFVLNIFAYASNPYAASGAPDTQIITGPMVGSSRIRTSGRCSSAWANPTR